MLLLALRWANKDKTTGGLDVDEMYERAAAEALLSSGGAGEVLARARGRFAVAAPQVHDLNAL